MRNLIKSVILFSLMLISANFYAQNRDLDNFRAPDKRGIHTFETPKDTTYTFENVKVRVGGSSTLQYQAFGVRRSTTYVFLDVRFCGWSARESEGK